MQQELDLLSSLPRKTASAETLRGLMGKVGKDLGERGTKGCRTPQQAQESAAGAGAGSPQGLGDDLRL